MGPTDPHTGERSHGPMRNRFARRFPMCGIGSSLERVVRVRLMLADISHMAEWIACSANSSKSIRRRAP
jgi:hypothetical protein